MYGHSKGWSLRRHIVLLEGTSDAALFGLVNRLSRSHGVSLFGEDISFVPAGERDRGGTFGVGRELITLRALSPYILDENGDLFYNIVGLVDDDYAGRKIIQDILNIDRSVVEFRDILRLRPVMVYGECTTPDALVEMSELSNADFRGLDWEIEDTISSRLMDVVGEQLPHAIRGRVTIGGRTHVELTREGKRELHRIIHREGTLTDLSGVVRIARTLRSIFGLPDLTVET